MANIPSLLNPSPTPEWVQTDSLSTSHKTTGTTPEPTAHQHGKKPRPRRDGFLFIEKPIVGKCRFPPDERQNEWLAVEHRKFNVQPLGRIKDCPRSIPYYSDKKEFIEKTGRVGLEVFAYGVQMPGEEKRHIILWDYNNGLVKTMPLFKIAGYPKNTVAKMLDINPGLRDISHNITGGDLLAQGYWMPYDAVRAIAATFAWEVRGALTPLFGIGFLDICIAPGHKGFGSMKLNPQIIGLCTQQCEAFRDLENVARGLSGANSQRTSNTMPGTSRNSSFKTSMSPPSVPNFERRMSFLGKCLMGIDQNPHNPTRALSVLNSPDRSKLRSPQNWTKPVPSKLNYHDSDTQSQASEAWWSYLSEEMRAAYVLLSLKWQISPHEVASYLGHILPIVPADDN